MAEHSKRIVVVDGKLFLVDTRTGRMSPISSSGAVEEFTEDILNELWGIIRGGPFGALSSKKK